MEHTLRVFDYNIYNAYDSSRDTGEENSFKDNNVVEGSYSTQQL